MNRPWELNIEFTKTDRKAVYVQIADAIIIAIKSKRLKAYEILPSTRKLASMIGVNRNTLLKALDILMIEGWLISKDRVGIFVADVKVDVAVTKEKTNQQTSSDKPQVILLDDGVPNTQIAPIKELASAYRRGFGLKFKRNILGYTDSRGSVAFREMIAQMLNHKRGLQVGASEICITRGSQMALYLTAQCLLTNKDCIIVEAPGYQPAWKVFEHTGAQVLSAKVDEQGIIIEEVKELLQVHKNIKAIYVTPHHQYPTTVTLTLQRRLELIELAKAHNFFIIEDDYDHEFHFDSRPILPIASYTTIEHYVYIGTFSKIVAPALRIGYLVGATNLIEKISALRAIIDIQNDPIMEQAVVELIKNGDIKRHIKRAIKYYKDKRLYLQQLLEEHLKDKIEYNLPSGGLAFWMRPTQKKITLDLLAKLKAQQIEIMDVSKYNPDCVVNGLRLGYGSVEKESLKKAIEVLSTLL
ncbi:MAG: PLP-dependent aminotransferase family protein [Aureispira sp.]